MSHTVVLTRALARVHSFLLCRPRKNQQQTAMIMQESSGPLETVHTGMKKQSMSSSSSSSSSTAAEAAADDDYEVVWKNLVHWVETEHGGYVHKALNLGIEHDEEQEGNDDDNDDKLLTTTFQNRGVIAMHGSIEKGELLIRLPACCVLSGKSLLDIKKILPTKQRELLASKSSWMQCIAAYYYYYNNTARNKNENCNSSSSCSSFYDPYLASLPKTYETLFQWTDEEIEKYLGGTTLGTMVQADRKSNSMKLRYQTAVRPVLETLGLLLSSSSSEQDLMEQEMEFFLEACNCISTRGFHYSSFMNSSSLSSSLSSSSLVDSSYHGPFLLPIIDLLNHNPSKSCTTLQYNHQEDDGGSFSMTAERYIAKGEAIVHSYGDNDSLTSGQLLQTFGFVVPSTNTNTTKSNRTAACLSKTKHLLPACLAIKQSNIPNRLQSKLKNKKKKNVNIPNDDDDDDPEIWNVQDIPTRDHHQLLADDILLLEEDEDDDDSTSTALPDGLITFLCMQFLPQDAYEELYPTTTTTNNNNNNEKDYSLSVLLDSSIILEDLYLGILVCRSLLLAMNMKLNDYYDNHTIQQEEEEKKKKNDVCLCEITNQVSNRISKMLLHMKRRPDDPVVVANDNDNNNSKQQQQSTTTVLRSMYGWTIRREEWISIQILCTKVTNRMKKLYKKLNHHNHNDDNDDEDSVRPPLQKRSKTGPSE
eukprot:scaffold54_cov110-Cylindrotheca_fusiformis.AAC.7